MLIAIFGGIIPVLVGATLLYIWPRIIHRKIESGKLSEEEGESILGRIPPRSGYTLIIVGVAAMFMELWQKDFFGCSKLLALLPATISIAFFVLWLRHRNSG